MYNDLNVQPEINNTGHGGSNNGEPKERSQHLSSSQLPQPVQAGGEGLPTAPIMPNPPVGQSTSQDQNQDGHWVQEVEQLFGRTTQNPRQRADEFVELRRRYQQEVLGIKPANREDYA